MRIGLGRPHKDFCKLKQTQLPKVLSIVSRMPSKLFLKSSFWLTKVESYKDVRKVGSLNGTYIVILKTILFFHSLGQKEPEQDNPLVSGHFPRAFRMHIIWGYSISMGPLPTHATGSEENGIWYMWVSFNRMWSSLLIYLLPRCLKLYFCLLSPSVVCFAGFPVLF